MWFAGQEERQAQEDSPGRLFAVCQQQSIAVCGVTHVMD